MRLRRTGMLTKIVLAVLLIYALVTKIGQSDVEKQKRSELEELKNYEAQLAASVDGMQYDIEHSTDEDVIRDLEEEAVDRELLEQSYADSAR